MEKSNPRRFINILCVVMGTLWISASFLGKLPGAIVGSVFGSLLAGPIGMIVGCLLGIGGQYCMESTSKVLNDLISLPLAMIIVILIGTAFDKWKKRKTPHDDDKGESNETDRTTQQ